MLKREKIEEEVEKTLAAFDNDPVLQENPFLMTRIKQMGDSKKYSPSKEFSLKLRLNWVISILVILLNIATIFYYLKADSRANLESRLVKDLKQEFQIEQSQNDL